MVTRVQSIAVAALWLVCLGAPQLADAAEIRFYDINRKGQQGEVGFVRNRDEPGCHNMFGGRDVFRVAQIGFTYCSVYSQKDCPDDEALTMVWKGRVKKNSVRAQPTERLMPGDLWYFQDNEEREIKSWKCNT
jgi:hypothetical protein